MLSSGISSLLRPLLALALGAAVLAGPVTAAPAVETGRAVVRPNIILITTDDMTRGDLRWMPRTRRLLQARGATVTDFIANEPMCCPSRAEILTGEYGQNNGVHANDAAPWGGYKALVQRLDHIGSWLRTAGYHTALVGKYLNGWELTARPDRGWTFFDPMLRRVYSPFGQTMFANGRPHRFRGVYTGHLITRLTDRLIQRYSKSRAPFFIWSSQIAPHDMNVGGQWGPPVPAPRDRTAYPAALPPSLSDPAFDEVDVTDKPAYVQRRPPVAVQRVIALHRARIRSLQAVDQQVGATVAALRRTGELRRTYLFFTSDNGFMLGEHRLVDIKNVPYLPSLGVPLLVRGPGVPAGVSRPALYGMVDLAPTFLALARAAANRPLDGRSMLGTLRHGAPGYGSYLIQAGSAGEDWWWRGILSTRYEYVRYSDGFEELYDLFRDPAQLTNVAADPAYGLVKQLLAARLAALQECSGPDCLGP
jgi:arylsulfatase A-like enzyme